MTGTVKDNVLLTCRAHNLPIEFAVYFLALIELAGGDRETLLPHPDEFVATVLRVSNEIDEPCSIEEVTKEVCH